jgi:hypothetical protein
MGAEIVRLWVASTDYSGDLNIDDKILARVVDAYRRIRNTLRFLLANVSDFDPATDAVAFDDMLEIDKVALSRAAQVQADIRAHFDAYEFHPVVSKLQLYCSEDLGAFYLDVLKDRLYTTAQLAKYSELRPRALANADSIDNANKGVEFRVTANVGDSLRFIVNYSYNFQERANVYKRTTLLFDQLDLFVADLVRANPGANVLGASGTQGTTVADLIAVNRADLDGRRLDFEGAFGNRAHKANFFVNYTFKQPRFAGWSAGFGGRYLSPIVTGRASTPVGVPPVSSGGNPGVDAMLRYQLRGKLLGRNVRASFQLNVRNLLDDHGIERRRFRSDGLTLERFVFTDPRELTLSTTLRF